MPTIPTPLTRSPLNSLACVNERCEVYGQAGQGNLTVRKVYGAVRQSCVFVSHVRSPMCRLSSTAQATAPHVEIRLAHGSQKRVTLALEKLGYLVANTSAIERRNGTARTMCAYQLRKSLAFARRTDTKQALDWWGVTVFNWCRPHRSLQQ